MSYCPECDGNAHVTCATCGGDGMVGARQERLCDDCHGSGYVECPECQDGGERNRERRRRFQR